MVMIVTSSITTIDLNALKTENFVYKNKETIDRLKELEGKIRVCDEEQKYNLTNSREIVITNLNNEIKEISQKGIEERKKKLEEEKNKEPPKKEGIIKKPQKPIIGESESPTGEEQPTSDLTTTQKMLLAIAVVAVLLIIGGIIYLINVPQDVLNEN